MTNPRSAIAANTTNAGPAAIGNVDYISDDGVVYGWAWNPAKPGERVEIEMLIDGVVADSIVARLYRDDLQKAGIDDGFYGFSWPLPYKALLLPRDVMVAARIRNTDEFLSPPQAFRTKAVADALEKVESLENDMRFLKSTIAQLSHREAQDNRNVASLFTTVSDFFAELAAVTAAGGSASQLRPVGSAVADITSTYAPFAFRTSHLPKISVIVSAAGEVSEIYQTLCTLHQSLGDTPSEVCLLDGGTSDESALLPLVAQNLRYVRVDAAASPVMRCNEAMRLAAGGIVVFCAPGLTPAPFWVTAVLAEFERTASLAALAANVHGEDGLLLSAGATQINGFSTPRGLGIYPDDTAFTAPCAVESVSVEFFALHRSNWELLGGLNEEFDYLPAALMEFCQRAAKANMQVQYEPAFGGVMPR
jgi:hypothetical protein